ncbi:hypothetical protein SARC_01064 [Sphaeroforma arctica JP610]|uniref:Uncharacterized protein n=1 Tax=Sphaeroforma arctica JP610 TaxID=667725 RepID=A0A0L0GCR1_9EUKA|nr:hypothetical protein SARC_01064 [Sphaeroforma arctica JP610]KNC86802.1 hypothetical protein SARC_01064 [Sphaeroforma arctica JP610]|eukprot:XP_014160704.1 hypothetical protein SARC_01064 [Sphaeroforma arctica JP610]
MRQYKCVRWLICICVKLIQAFNIASDQIGKDAVTTAKVRLDACSAGFVLIAVLDVALLVMVGTMPGSLLGWLNLDSMPLPFRKKRS